MLITQRGKGAERENEWPPPVGLTNNGGRVVAPVDGQQRLIGLRERPIKETQRQLYIVCPQDKSEKVDSKRCGTEKKLK